MAVRTRKPAAPPPARNVKVRMYRDILGDCFLLRFPAKDRTVHVLIDFGILQGMPGAKERAARIAADIKRVTTKLDVVVATHEHVDHLSGFAQAADVLDGVEIEELWLAWTEDPRDEQAMRLRTHRRKAAAVLERSFAAASERLGPTLAESGDVDDDETDGSAGSTPKELAGLLGLMAFSGFDPNEPLGAAAATTAGILDALKRKAGRVRYLAPGDDAFALPGTDARVYVLGPPRDEARLRRSDPSRTNPEVYELAADGNDKDFLLAAVLGEGGGEAARRGLPFGPRDLIPFPDGQPGGRTGLAASADFDALYGRPGEDWRRVDVDWLGAAEQLALKLDSDTNNTSLALALEIGAGGDARVLLFPGDAQVGNWLSWGDLAWPPGSKEGEAGRVTIERLFARTVLYKVGHHCSHNATLRDRGLELMTHRDLVAMIPVHEDFARSSKHWNMPFPSLLSRLNSRAAGRVLRADRGKSDLQAIAASLAGKDGQLTREEWDEFLLRVSDVSDATGEVAIEYSLP